MTVLIVTRSDDNESVALVTRAIEARGGRAFRFDTDRFPTEVQLVARYDATGEQLTLTSEQGVLDLRAVTALWHRRLGVGARLPAEMERQMRRAALGEARATVGGLLAGIDAFRLDPEPLIRRADHKQLQLQVARKVGLLTPRTLITNDPAAVRAFAADCPGGLITKMLSSFAVYDEAGAEQVVFTNPVAPEDLNDLDGLRLCPMTFQERVPKALELRATVVGERILTAAIASQSSTRARHDWRRDGAQLQTAWQPYELPADVTARLLRLMDYFGLNYGAVDLILTPDNEHVFLEVNPVGEFFWLEESPGLPISAAIADVLLGRANRRPNAPA